MNALSSNADVDPSNTSTTVSTKFVIKSMTSECVYIGVVIFHISGWLFVSSISNDAFCSILFFTTLYDVKCSSTVLSILSSGERVHFANRSFCSGVKSSYIFLFLLLSAVKLSIICLRPNLSKSLVFFKTSACWSGSSAAYNTPMLHTFSGSHLTLGIVCLVLSLRVDGTFIFRSHSP